MAEYLPANAHFVPSPTTVSEYRKTRSSQKSPAELRSIHQDRWLLVQLAALLAEEAGYRSWISYDEEKEHPRWPSITIELPSGQVSFLVPPEQVFVNLDEDTKLWDQHTAQERMQRIREFLLTATDVHDSGEGLDSPQ